MKIPAFPNFFQMIFFGVAEVYQWRCLEERGQWVENVNRTHLVLASGYYKNIELKIPLHCVYL